MCGIAGIIGPSARRVAAMAKTLAHRGPDDEGVWLDEAAGVGLGHRRLAIVDLSPHGHQPMRSASDRYVISYNGEVYNHRELRANLEAAGRVPGGGWRGHSDTETLVEAIAAWGLEDTLGKAVGMFAFALWDREERTLHLVRDRFGEKPLYYGWAGRDFVFSSELKAIRALPSFDAAIDRSALRLFAARSYVPAPLSIYRGIFKLEPGCILSVRVEAALHPLNAPPAVGTSEGGLSLAQYWSYRDVMLAGMADPIADEDEALDQLEQALAQAIRGQSIADVPVGAFLSGGIDSSTVVALYQKYSPQPVRSYSIGFEAAGFDEAIAARAVAKYLGTVHHEHYLSLADARNVIPMLPAMYDEPFADSSQIPTYLVSWFARRDVAVALTGDGGDELFAGYNRHVLAPRLWRGVERVPGALRELAGVPLKQISSHAWDRVGAMMPGTRQPQFGGRLQKAIRIGAGARSFDQVYGAMIDQWSGEPSPVIGGIESDSPLDLELPGASDTLRMMFCDAVSYLPDDILCKVDRASMAVSLETRVPFLDHRVAQVAARIPLSMKIKHGRSKYILRQLLYRQAPGKLFDRPKRGFAIPVSEWLKGPLRAWAEELLDPQRMAEEGWFDPAIVRPRWESHLSGETDSTSAIWNVLMFQAWLREGHAAARSTHVQPT